MILEIVVKPGSKENKLIKINGRLILFIKAKASHGQANKNIINFLSKKFNKNVRIIKGLTSKKKLVEIL